MNKEPIRVYMKKYRLQMFSQSRTPNTYIKNTGTKALRIKYKRMLNLQLKKHLSILVQLKIII